MAEVPRPMGSLNGQDRVIGSTIGIKRLSVEPPDACPGGWALMFSQPHCYSESLVSVAGFFTRLLTASKHRITIRSLGERGKGWLGPNYVPRPRFGRPDPINIRIICASFLATFV